MGEGWTLLRIRGIPLRIHPSWFVILLLATMAFRQQYALVFANEALPATLLWPLGFTTALLLFVSVLLHELGHSMVAIAQGVKVRSITLFLMGGVASVERECSTAIGALLVAAAGPAVSLLLAALLLGSSHQASHLSPYLGEVVKELGNLNLVLALFNLLPGLPLDGGLILKALVWQITGSQRRGVQVANGSGRFLSLLAVTLGTLMLLRGAGMGSIWLILLGWFGLGAARNQQQQLALQKALKEMRVSEAMRRRFRVLEADSSLRDLSRLQMREEGPADWLLVTHRGRWQGVLPEQTLQQVPVQHWDTEKVGDHLEPLSSLPQLRDDDGLWRGALLLEDSATPRLLVIGPAGLPVGTLERPELAEAVLAKLGVRLPAALLESARRQRVYPLGLALDQVARSMLTTGEVGGPEGDPPQAG
ncbi:MAG: site-2 protease family protein [Prochlorococcaceae cyanobacterium]